MSKKKIIVLGAGLAGLSAAWHLQKRGIDCVVFDKEAEAGGLCRSKTINGFTFDYDGHLLHFRQRDTLELAKGLLGENLREHKRNAWVYTYGKYTRYPFQANLYGLPIEITKECLSAFIQAQNSSLARKNGNFLNWINAAFGSGIAKHFMVPYNNKFWTVSPRDLTCDWLEGFIPVPTLEQVIEGTVEESKRRFGYNSHFWYPSSGGIATFSRAFAGKVKNIHLNRRVEKIDLVNKEIEFSEGTKEKFDYLISTVPLPEFLHLASCLPQSVRAALKKLRWNSIFNLNLGIKKHDPSERHWVYFPQKNISFFRLGYFHNFSSSAAPERHMSLYAEVSYSKERPIAKQRIIARIKKDLYRLGVIAQKDAIVAVDVNDMTYGYPLYDRNYNRARNEILGFLSGYGVIGCGRYGAWKYMSMEDAIIDGKRAAEIL